MSVPSPTPARWRAPPPCSPPSTGPTSSNTARSEAQGCEREAELDHSARQNQTEAIESGYRPEGRRWLSIGSEQRLGARKGCEVTLAGEGNRHDDQDELPGQGEGHSALDDLLDGAQLSDIVE